MDVGDLVDVVLLKEWGFRLVYPDIYAFETGLPNVCVYHSKEKQLDVKIVKQLEYPDTYKVMLKRSTKDLYEALKRSIEKDVRL